MAPKLQETAILCFAVARQTLLAEIMKQTAELETRRAPLEKEMREVAPPECQKFLAMTSVIENLLLYGRANEKYYYDGSKGYSLGTSRVEVEMNLQRLCAAWNDEVVLDLRSDQGTRVELWLRLKQ